MKNTITILTILISSLSIGQTYDKMYIENSKIDKNNKIYRLGKEFNFTLDIKKDSSNYFIKNNEDKSIELTKNIDSVLIDEINLIVIKPKIFQRTNKKQTEILYSYESSLKPIKLAGFVELSSTGLVENDKNIWTHPPRNGFFKSLETCPFPYIMLDKAIGFKWNDSMNIGSQWSNNIWGEWNGNLLLQYEYQITGNEKVILDSEEIDCIIVEATATSELGTSKLKSYFSDKYGFVELHYTLANGIEIDIILNKVVDGRILRDGKEYFFSKYK